MMMDIENMVEFNPDNEADGKREVERVGEGGVR